MAIKFKKSKIPIRWHGGSEEVDAYVSGNLCVHKIISDEAKLLWVISHVGTGFSVGYSYPPFRIMKEAKAVVEDLLAEDDWSGENPDKLFDILVRVMKKHTGIFSEKHGTIYKEAIEKIPSPQSKCVKCGVDSERLLLSQFNNVWGWYSWCFKCMPHDKSIEKEPGKLSRWGGYKDGSFQAGSI